MTPSRKKIVQDLQITREWCQNYEDQHTQFLVDIMLSKKIRLTLDHKIIIHYRKTVHQNSQFREEMRQVLLKMTILDQVSMIYRNKIINRCQSDNDLITKQINQLIIQVPQNTTLS